VPLPSDCTAGKIFPGYGPPLLYNTPNAHGAIGGNPAVKSFLSGDPMLLDPGESGWKDAARAFSGQVLRLLKRWTPTGTLVVPSKSSAGRTRFVLDPTEGAYVWHCNTIDLEDNEMMWPYRAGKWGRPGQSLHTARHPGRSIDLDAMGLTIGE